MKVYKFFLVLAVLSLGACSSNSSDDEAVDRFPFMANIEYRVSSTDGMATADLYFVNQEKEAVRFTDETLPYENSFDVLVEFGDEYFITALTDSDNLKVALYVDGELMKEIELVEENGSNSGSIVHQFGIVDVTSLVR